MKYTNKQNLPEALYQAIANDPYEKESDFSASELPIPPQIRVLRERYNDKITVDVAHLIYPLIGNNTHYILERMGIKNALQEERFFHKFWGDFTVSGKLDFYDSEKILWDYKITTRWTLVDGAKPDWKAQLNINAHLLRMNNFTVNGGKVCAIFRDWSKIQAIKNPDYPKHQVAIFPITLWKPEDVEKYINARIQLHFYAGYELDYYLPECTPEERWEKPTAYAIMKKGRKKAVRVLTSQNLAEKYIESKNLDDKHSIVERIGKSPRCEYYCDVKDFCQQYKRMKEGK